MSRPMANDTSYRSAFTCPPESLFAQHFYDGPAKDMRSTLKVGDGPMQGESTAMVDYQDPDVGTHLPTRPVKDAYKPPQCRMETTTTTGSTYPGWKVFPNQVRITIPLVMALFQKMRQKLYSQGLTFQHSCH